MVDQNEPITVIYCASNVELIEMISVTKMTSKKDN